MTRNQMLSSAGLELKLRERVQKPSTKLEALVFINALLAASLDEPYEIDSSGCQYK